ncbi:hypothetical protein D3C85_1592820 [compost metagenome]
MVHQHVLGSLAGARPHQYLVIAEAVDQAPYRKRHKPRRGCAHAGVRRRRVSTISDYRPGWRSARAADIRRHQGQLAVGVVPTDGRYLACFKITCFT